MFQARKVNPSLRHRIVTSPKHCLKKTSSQICVVCPVLHHAHMFRWIPVSSHRASLFQEWAAGDLPKHCFNKTLSQILVVCPVLLRTAHIMHTCSVGFQSAPIGHLFSRSARRAICQNIVLTSGTHAQAHAKGQRRCLSCKMGLYIALDHRPTCLGTARARGEIE